MKVWGPEDVIGGGTILVLFAMFMTATVFAQQKEAETTQEQTEEQPAEEEATEEGTGQEGLPIGNAPENWQPSDQFKTWLTQRGVVGFSLDFKPEGEQGTRWCAVYIRYLDGKERCIAN